MTDAASFCFIVLLEFHVCKFLRALTVRFQVSPLVLLPVFPKEIKVALMEEIGFKLPF